MIGPNAHNIIPSKYLAKTYTSTSVGRPRGTNGATDEHYLCMCKRHLKWAPSIQTCLKVLVRSTTFTNSNRLLIRSVDMQLWVQHYTMTISTGHWQPISLTCTYSTSPSPSALLYSTWVSVYSTWVSTYSIWAPHTVDTSSNALVTCALLTAVYSLGTCREDSMTGPLK